MLPLGLWQWWAIFAPEPLRENRVLEAEVIDAKGLIHIYEFTKIGDMSAWQKLGRYRNPKFTDNMMTGGEYGTASASSRLAMWFASWGSGRGVSPDRQSLREDQRCPTGRNTRRTTQ